jgi:hypothetical protein
MGRAQFYSGIKGVIHVRMESAQLDLFSFLKDATSAHVSSGGEGWRLGSQ